MNATYCNTDGVTQSHSVNFKMTNDCFAEIAAG